MLSRVANYIYWLARYLERAENISRLIDVNAQLAIDMQSLPGESAPAGWEPLLRVTADEGRFAKFYPEPTARNILNYMIFERRNPNSLYSCIHQARENARCIREALSGETWEQINRLYLRIFHENYDDLARIGESEFINRTRSSILLFYGIFDSMIPRKEGWFFFEVGRYLERADYTSRLIDVKYFTLLPESDQVGSALDLIQWASVLRSCSAFEAFRKNRRGLLTPSRVTDYLILDEFFPHSIRYSIIQAEENLRRISQDSDHHFSNPPVRALGRLRADLDYALIKDIVAGGLHEYLDSLQLKIADIHQAIIETYIDYPLENAPIRG
ncbi:MAG: alpha-E domain-containing protein [Puniceicoccaceae bacterium]|nr:MAG: alpha-E domain-containing protein [Puniceicoccaceae bacterium]